MCLKIFMKMLMDKNADWSNIWLYFAWSIVQVPTVLSLIFSDFDNIFIDLSNIFFDFLLNFFDSPKAVVEQLGQYFMS